MKKNYFLWAIMLFATTTYAQKTLILNGGKFGDPKENANLLIYDTQTKQYSSVDTIHTPSVQELLIDGDDLFVAAQDSNVKYNLTRNERSASAAFQGLSTKDLCVVNNYLWVSNFYGQTKNNIYVYNKGNLSVVDSLPGVSRAVSSMVAGQNFLYASQNSTTSSYTDTLGIILKIDLASRSIVDTIAFPNYTQDVGQLVLRNNNLLAFNSISNTIGVVDLNSNQSVINPLNLNISVGSKSNYSIFKDTVFVKVKNDIAAINLNDYSIIDSSLVDTVVTAFSYDTVNHQFFISQTDYYSYRKGAIYSRGGLKLDSLQVGYSPEGIRVYYDQAVGISQLPVQGAKIKIFPNPATNHFKIQFDKHTNTAKVEIFNELGALVKSKNSYFNQAIDISDLSKGVYFVRLEYEGSYGLEKLIIR